MRRVAEDLHFTLILLKLLEREAAGGAVMNLHFTLILLKLYKNNQLEIEIVLFTFHFDSIKTLECKSSSAKR